MSLLLLAEQKTDNQSMALFKKIRINFFLTFLLACVAFGCQSSNIAQNLERNFSNVQLEWNTIAEKPYISTAEYSEKNLLIHCVKVDLSNPNLKIKMLPQTPEQINSVYVKDFAKENNLAVAFNTTPFLAEGIFKNKNQTPAGISVIEGEQISKPLKAYCALAFFEEEQGFSARIFASQKEEGLQSASFAAGGFWQILKDGQIVQFNKIRDSRTFCAIDKAGATLFVFAVEGENKNRSSGLTYMECAEFVKALGLENAMEFDGGGSTQLVVNGKSLLTYKNKVKVPSLLGFE